MSEQDFGEESQSRLVPDHRGPVSIPDEGGGHWRGSPAVPRKASSASGWRGDWRHGSKRDHGRWWRRVVLGATALGLVVASAALIIMLLPNRKAPLLTIVATDYRFPIPPNSFARQDADFLQALGDSKPVSDFLFGNSRQFKGRPATLDRASSSDQFLAEISEFVEESARSRPIDERKPSIVYLSLHGVERAGIPYLLLPNAESWADDSNANSGWVSMESVLNELCPEDETSRMRILLVLDCQRIRTQPAMGVVSNRFEGSLKDLCEKKGESRFGKAIQAGRLIILSSAKDGQVAWSPPGVGGSVFGRFVAAGLAGHADLDKNGTVLVSEIVQYVTGMVSRWAADHRPTYPQTPWSLPEISSQESLWGSAIADVELAAFDASSLAAPPPSITHAEGSDASSAATEEGGTENGIASTPASTESPHQEMPGEELIEEKWRILDVTGDSSQVPWYRHHPATGAAIIARLLWCEDALLAGEEFLTVINALPTFGSRPEVQLPERSICLNPELAENFKGAVSSDSDSPLDRKRLGEFIVTWKDAFESAPVERVLAQWIHDYIPSELWQSKEDAAVIRRILHARLLAEQAALGPRGARTDPRVFLKIAADDKTVESRGFISLESTSTYDPDKDRRKAEDLLFVANRAEMSDAEIAIEEALKVYEASINVMAARERAYDARDRSLAAILSQAAQSAEWQDQVENCVNGLRTDSFRSEKQVEVAASLLLDQKIDVNSTESSDSADRSELWARLESPPASAADRATSLKKYRDASLTKDAILQYQWLAPASPPSDAESTPPDQSVDGAETAETPPSRNQAAPSEANTGRHALSRVLKMGLFQSIDDFRQNWKARFNEKGADVDLLVRIAAPFLAGFPNKGEQSESKIADQEIDEAGRRIWNERLRWQADRMLGDFYGPPRPDEIAFYKDAWRDYRKDLGGGAERSTEQAKDDLAAGADGLGNEQGNPFQELRPAPIYPFDDVTFKHSTRVVYSPLVTSKENYEDKPAAEIAKSGKAAFWLMDVASKEATTRVPLNKEGKSQQGVCLDLSRDLTEGEIVSYWLDRKAVVSDSAATDSNRHDKPQVGPFAFWRGWTCEGSVQEQVKPDYSTFAESKFTGISKLKVSVEADQAKQGTIIFVVDYSESMSVNLRQSEPPKPNGDGTKRIDVARSEMSKCLDQILKKHHETGGEPPLYGLILFGHRKKLWSDKIPPWPSGWNAERFAPSEDHAELVSPSKDVEVVIAPRPLDVDTVAASKSLLMHFGPKGYTPLYRAINKAIDLAISTQKPPYRIVVLSDGGDSEERVREDLINNWRKSAAEVGNPTTPMDVTKKIESLHKEQRSLLSITILTLDGSEITDTNGKNYDINKLIVEPCSDVISVNPTDVGDLANQLFVATRRLEMVYALADGPYKQLRIGDVHREQDGMPLEIDNRGSVPVRVKDLNSSDPEASWPAVLYGADDIVTVAYRSRNGFSVPLQNGPSLMSFVGGARAYAGLTIISNLRVGSSPDPKGDVTIEVSVEDKDEKRVVSRPNEVLWRIQDRHQRTVIGVDPYFVPDQSCPVLRLKVNGWRLDRKELSIDLKIRPDKGEGISLPLKKCLDAEDGIAVPNENSKLVVRMVQREKAAGDGAGERRVVRLMILEALKGDGLPARVIRVVDREGVPPGNYSVSREYFSGKQSQILHTFDIEGESENEIRDHWSIAVTSFEEVKKFATSLTFSDVSLQ